MTLASRGLMLVGIPVSALFAIMFDVQLSRVLYAGAAPLPLTIELASLAAVVAQVRWLRKSLAEAPAGSGMVGDALDFLAVRRLHVAVLTAAMLSIGLPLAWFARLLREVFVSIAFAGFAALRGSTVQSSLDAIAVAVQHTLVAALPLLALVHLTVRRFPNNAWLAWLLVPLCVVGTGIGIVLSVTFAHFAG